MYRVDLKANRTFELFDHDIDIYFWILNVFDRDNAIDVYIGSGLPDDTSGCLSRLGLSCQTLGARMVSEHIVESYNFV